MQLNRIILAILAGFLASCSNEENIYISRNRLDITEHDFGCSYSGGLDLEKIYLFKSNDDVEANISEIMSHTGLSDNFTVKAADVHNACALIKGNKRYILYNQLFIQNVASETKSKLGALSILAHEIGHHLNGHTFLDLKDDVRIQLELEADRFSGFIMARYGASLDEALKAIQVYGSEKESSTHPSKRTRIAAITNGYMEGKIGSKDSEELAVQKNSEFKYVIDLAKPPIAMRNKSLSPDEIRIANSGSKQAVTLNKQTIMADLPNGTPVELLSQVNNTYFIRAFLEGREITGYIVKKYGGKPTIIRSN